MAMLGDNGEQSIIEHLAFIPCAVFPQIPDMAIKLQLERIVLILLDVSDVSV